MKSTNNGMEFTPNTSDLLRQEMTSTITHLCEQFLKSIENPEKLRDVMSHIASRERLRLDLIFQFAKQCHSEIKRIDDMRAVRAPIQDELNTIQQQIQQLLFEKKKIPTDLDERQKKLQQKIDALPYWPYFANLYNPGQYTWTTLDVGQSLIKSILSAEEKYEATVATLLESELTMDKNLEIEYKRNEFKNRLEEAIQLFLSHVDNPKILFDFQQFLQQHKRVKLLLAISGNVLLTLL